MKYVYILVMILLCIGVAWCTSSEVWAIDAYFDSQISTKLEYKPDTGTLLVKMLKEEVPPVFLNIVYEQAIYVEIIFDASKTMAEPDINGIRKIDIAKDIATILVNYFPHQDTRFALRVNGAKYPNNCLDSELVIPFRRENAQQVLDAVEKIQPKGLSPLSYSIRQVLQDFAGTKGTKIVFVITDGLETCDVEPADACTVTMDLLQQTEFEGTINVIGVNPIYDEAKLLLSCLAARGNGEFLDSNRDSGNYFVQIIRESSQLRYNISKIIDPETLAEGKILELINLCIGDTTAMEGETIVLQSKTGLGYSSHELEPGVYKIEFATIPPLVSYFTIDRQQQLNIGIVRSGRGLDLYDRAHLTLGNWYYDRGKIEEALAEYQKVIEFDERNVDAHLNLGIIYDDILKDEEKATTHYKMYLELAGPRQEEVREWLRIIRGEVTREEELLEKVREAEAEAEKDREEEKKKEELAKREAERQKVLEVYKEILTANPDIVKLSEEAVIRGEDLHVIVSGATTDSKARNIALDVGRRMQRYLNLTPEVIIYRENKPDVSIGRARYDVSQQQYIILSDAEAIDEFLGQEEVY